MQAKVFRNRKGRHRKDSLLVHEPHRFIAELIRMVHRSDSRLCGIQGARLSRGVHGDSLAQSLRFMHGSSELLLRILIWCGKLAVGDGIVPSFVDLAARSALLVQAPTVSAQWVWLVRRVRVGWALAQGA